MKRRLLNLLTALSLLLCVAVVVLWVRSYGGTDRLERYQRTSGGGLYLCRGYFTAGWYTTDGRSGMAPMPLKYERVTANMEPHRTPLKSADRDWALVGFRFSSRDTPDGWADRMLVVPLWSCCVVLAAAPAVFAARRLRGRRTTRRGAAGLCPACGSDLRASPGRCPECGRQATQPTGSSSAHQATLPHRG